MTDRPLIRTQQDLQDAWHFLMSPLGFSHTSTWFMLIDADDLAAPHVTQIEEDGRPPTPEQLAGLVSMLSNMRDELAAGGRVAFLRSRPGHAGLTAADRAWARSLYEVSRSGGLAVEVLHRAFDVDLVPMRAPPISRTRSGSPTTTRWSVARDIPTYSFSRERSRDCDSLTHSTTAGRSRPLHLRTWPSNTSSSQKVRQ